MSEFDKPSPLPLVSHWPDEEEKHSLIAYYFNSVRTDANGCDLIVDPNILAGGAKHHMRKRAEQAARTAKRMHEVNRKKGFERAYNVKSLQSESLNIQPAHRLELFAHSPSMPSIEIFAKNRVGERHLESDKSFSDSAIRWVTSRFMATGLYDQSGSDPQTSFKIPSHYIDQRHMLSVADIASKTVLARYIMKGADEPSIELKARHVGVLPLDPERLTRLEMLHIGSLTYKRVGDLSPENLEEPKKTLRRLVERDLHLPDEDRLIEPSMMMLYLCRTGLESAQRSSN